MTFTTLPKQSNTAFVEKPPARRLRLLFLAPFAPRLDADHGGSRVIAQLVGRLAARHDIALCYLRAADEPSIDRTLAGQCSLVEEVVLPEVGTSPRLRLAHKVSVWLRLLSGTPLWAIGRSADVFDQQVRKIIRDWKPDIIQFEYHIMGQYLPACRAYPAPRILVEHEPGESAAREALMAHRTPGRVMPWLDRSAWKKFERAVLRQVQAVVVFTEHDREVLAKNVRNAPLVRIPLGTELPEQPLSPLGKLPYSLLFFGNFAHPPNVDAAERLIFHIFPAVQERFPEAVLYIVGSHPPRQICEGAGKKIIVTGFVPDLAPYLDNAALVAAPLRLGGGMRVKVIEALAAGKALVASPLAVAGLDLSNGEQVALAEDDHAFSQAIIYLLENPNQRAVMAASARVWACAHADWDTSVAAYEKLYQALLNGQPLEIE